jgi:hypothetical protein
MVACEGAKLTIELEAVFPTRLDYEKSAASVDLGAKVQIGHVALSEVQLVRGSPTVLLSATVPPSLPPGQYDLSVKFNDDRPEAILANAFSVAPTLYPDSFLLDPIRDQTRGIPFLISVRAQGPNASRFNCTVTLSSNHGHLAPTLSDSFQRGIRLQQVMIDAAHPRMQIRVEDDQGHFGLSNPFIVDP